MSISIGLVRPRLLTKHTDNKLVWGVYVPFSSGKGPTEIYVFLALWDS